MFHLREGMTLNGRPLEAAMLDALAEQHAEEPLADSSFGAVLETIRERARVIVAAGLEAQLSLRHLSLIELQAIGAERCRVAAENREIHAALIVVMQQGLVDPLDVLPSEDVELNRKRFIAKMRARAVEILTKKGGGA